MGEPCFEVVEPGFQTTVQDVGRPGLLATGMPPSGAFDTLSLRLANLLVGNNPGGRFLVGESPGDAGLEMLLLGPELRVLRETVVAVCGADLSGTLNGESLVLGWALAVRKGDVLAFPRVRRGVRAYLAVAGGIDVPEKLGSRSTNIRARVGGIEGRALQPGDVIECSPPSAPADELVGRKLASRAVPLLGPPWEIRIVLGPQEDLFLPESVERFLEFEWKLSPTSDRMGCRFIGPELGFRPRAHYLVEQAGSDPSNIVDDTIPVGGIQVPGGVEPIAMGPDGPSLGGYAKIATVISADLRQLGQVRPGETVRFRAVRTDEALEALCEVNALVGEDSLERA